MMRNKIEPPVRSNKAVSSRRGVRRPSEFALKLWEKQKVKDAYGLREARLRNCLKKFQRENKKKERLGDLLFLAFLERGLDNAVYRLGVVSSRRAARQLVAHGKIVVNGCRVYSPSFRLKTGDRIEIRGADFSKEAIVPSWLGVDRKKKQAVVLRLPAGEEVEPDIDEKLVIEYYSR